MDLASQEIHSVEALVRWRHPNGNLLYPQQFIPLAEDIGIIGAIDEWVLKHAIFSSVEVKIGRH